MTNIHQCLQEAASQNTKLLQTISDTASSVASFQQIQNQIAILVKEINKQKQKLAEASISVEKEYDDHRKFRDASSIKRLAYTIGGKKEEFLDQAAKEEKEWLDALASQLAIQRTIESLKGELNKAKEQESVLKKAASAHNSAVVELDALYNNVFKGPTPSFPAEDAKEDELAAAEQQFNMFQIQFLDNAKAFDNLDRAWKLLDRARQTVLRMDEEFNYVQFSREKMKRFLASFNERMSEAESLLTRANLLQPAITPLNLKDLVTWIVESKYESVAKPNSFRPEGEVFGAKEYYRSIEKTLEKQMALIKQQEKRVQASKAQVDVARLELAKRRTELQDVRRKALEKLAEFPPPKYQEPAELPACCRM